jgi:hypothetical protein
MNSTLPAVAATVEIPALATCPLCHMADPDITSNAVAIGVGWQCARCGQRWTANRLATTAAYAAWVSERNARL